MILVETQVIEIYQIKITKLSLQTKTNVPSNDINNKESILSPAAVAKSHGVSSKAIREIWSGRTWFRQLMHLDLARAAMVHRIKLPGRPMGAKGKRTRQDEA